MSIKIPSGFHVAGELSNGTWTSLGKTKGGSPITKEMFDVWASTGRIETKVITERTSAFYLFKKRK